MYMYRFVMECKCTRVRVLLRVSFECKSELTAIYTLAEPLYL